MTLVASYFCHAGLFISAALTTIKFKGFDSGASLASLAWLVIGVILLVSGFRLIKMVDPVGGDQ